MDSIIEKAKEAWENHWDLWITEQSDWGDIDYEVTASVEIFGDSPITFEYQPCPIENWLGGIMQDGSVMIYRDAVFGHGAFCYIYDPISGDITEADINIQYYRE